MMSSSFKERGQKNCDVICGWSLFYAICGLPLNMTYNTVISQVALHHLSISIPDISTQKACLMDGVFRLRLLKNKNVKLGLRKAWEWGTKWNTRDQKWKEMPAKNEVFFTAGSWEEIIVFVRHLFSFTVFHIFRALSIKGMVLRRCLDQ